MPIPALEIALQVLHKTHDQQGTSSQYELNVQLWNLTFQANYIELYLELLDLVIIPANIHLSGRSKRSRTAHPI